MNVMMSFATIRYCEYRHKYKNHNVYYKIRIGEGTSGYSLYSNEKHGLNILHA